MPNLTLFIPAQAMPADPVLAALTDHCTALCTDVLLAAVQNVHIIYVPVRHGRGHPVFAELRYRRADARTPAVMQRFMAAIDDAIRGATGATARIRCLGHAPAELHARN
ncbi:hypothetical protein QE400_004121 [Xanthomonas sacchari]|nr:hypothetical protein [Xanthomonas sacchari]